MAVATVAMGVGMSQQASTAVFTWTGTTNNTWDTTSNDWSGAGTAWVIQFVNSACGL